MSNIAINRVTNANIYLDGKSLLGRAEEVNLPDVKYKMSEHKALGMVGSIEVWSGIEKMEASIKWNSIYADVLKKTSNPFSALKIQVRADVEGYNSQGRVSEVPSVTYLTGQFKNAPMGNFKQHDNVELTSMLSVTYVKQVINGEDVIEIDVLANIFKVNGVDVLAQYRNNIGG